MLRQRARPRPKKIGPHPNLPRKRGGNWRGPRAKPTSSQTCVLLHKPSEILRVGVARIDIASIVRADAFERTQLLGFRNEGGDLLVLDGSDPDALLEARIGLGVRLRIGHVDGVVLVDVDAARPAELLPLVEELAVLVTDLAAV